MIPVDKPEMREVPRELKSKGIKQSLWGIRKVGRPRLSQAGTRLQRPSTLRFSIKEELQEQKGRQRARVSVDLGSLRVCLFLKQFGCQSSEGLNRMRTPPAPTKTRDRHQLGMLRNSQPQNRSSRGGACCPPLTLTSGFGFKRLGCKRSIQLSPPPRDRLRAPSQTLPRNPAHRSTRTTLHRASKSIKNATENPRTLPSPDFSRTLPSPKPDSSPGKQLCVGMEAANCAE